MRGETDPHLVRFVARHAAVGAGIAAVAVALMLAADLGGLRGLVARSDVGGLALAVMTVFFMITCGSVQIGIAMMLHLAGEAEEDRRSPGPGRAAPFPIRRPVRRRRR